MVNFALFFTIAFSLFISQHVIAAPSTAAAAPAVASRSIKDTRFSFADWVDTIIANPETALKPREAVQAFIDSMNATESANSSSSNGGLEKRWEWHSHKQLACGDGFQAAWAIDAASCIKTLAARGQETCVPIVPDNRITKWTLAYCVSGTAAILAFNKPAQPGGDWDTCASIAQNAGIIMDACTYLKGSVDLVHGWRPDREGSGTGANGPGLDMATGIYHAYHYPSK